MKDGKFDFVAKNNYLAYNEALSMIPDDASNLDETLK